MTDFVMRSDDEIVRYYRKVARGDFFGVWGNELLSRVSLKAALPFIKDAHEWSEESWKKNQRKVDKISIIEEMEDYIQDAVEKTTSHRKNIVVALDFYRAWTWLMKDMDLFAYLIDDRNFPNFGAPMLSAVIEKYSFFDLLPDDEIRKSAFQNMAQGKKCNDLCVRGCMVGNPTARASSSLILPSALQPKTVLTPKLTP